MVDVAVQSCPTVQQVFVAMRTENPVSMTAKDVAMEEVRRRSENQSLITILIIQNNRGLQKHIASFQKCR